MDTPSFLEQIRPRAYARYQALPLFGAVIADFSVWLSARGYRTKTIKSQLKGVRYVDRWLRRKGRRRLSHVTDMDMHMAHHRFRSDSNIGGPVRSLGQFLRERGLIVATPPTNPSFSERERERFGQYLRAVRGFAESSVLHHQRLLTGWLSFRQADKHPANVNEITADTIEAYLRLSAKTNNRFSLQQVVANLRGYLRWQHAEGRLKRPLHEEIDAPRCYRLEKLPRALPWQQLTALLRSIERSPPRGHRDFALLYLAAYYGLRSHELVAIKLEDIDWRAATLRIHQRKTKQSLLLPLTDEAGAILARYLREARTASSRRELFLRARAPMGPLQPTAVHDILDARIRRSGLPIRMTGSHLLRHSFALHLLRQGVSTKQIGDALGHRDVESTCVYLRLDTEDFREVGLPVPTRGRASALVPFTWAVQLPRVVTARLPAIRRNDFRGPFASALEHYVGMRRALGRGWGGEERCLRQWDDFLVRDREPFARAAFERWNGELGGLCATVRRNRLRIVRNFLLFYRRDHPRTWVPDLSLLPKKGSYRPAHVVLPVDIARILATAERLPVLNCSPLRPQIMRIAFLLLYCCGLRLGELLRLRVRHYDARERLLRIDETKFHKSRLVPLHVSVARELDRFLAQWPSVNRGLEPDQPLVWSGRTGHSGNAITATAVRHCWLRLCGSAGIFDHRGRPPHVHDLRHSMAVGALHRCYQRGRDPNALLPKLATYLGHVSPISTHHYLQLTPELRRVATQRFHAACGQLFRTGGAA